MDKKCYIFFILVLLTIHQSSALTKAEKAAVHLEEMWKENPACTRIKCPPVSDPMCVRLKYVTSALESNTVYVVMINRCEIKHVMCHKGVNAKEVPMTYCDHGKNITSDLKKLEERIRKRIVQTKPPKIEDTQKINRVNISIAVPIPVLIRHKRRAAYSNREDSIQAEIKKSNIAKRNKEISHLNDVKRQLFANNKEIARERDREHEFNIFIKGTNGNVSKLEVTDEGNSDTKKLKINAAGDVGGNNGDVDDVPGDGDNDQQGDISDRIEYTINSGEDKLEDVNMEQYEQSCPTSCPARGVMTCGKCKDGIFRTFLSPCHMRMFDCGHPEEKLTVVAWAPCAMSGPYLEDLRVPVGRIDEPNDEDVVLRYLKCLDYENKLLKPYSRLNCTDFDELKKKQKQTADNKNTE